jgi:hypothetical protein
MYKETYLAMKDSNNVKLLDTVRIDASQAKVGDVIFSMGEYAYVEQIIHWHPEDGGRPKCPIHAHWVAVQIKTDTSDRWYGYSLSDH